uniref:histidine kinase n=1 Tax=Roseihalotalea indica TaxID=2867963 RepID=A0AA49JFZ8_9BACT|nr:PAS domain S-box protein [Tunicatimonas sp. TK19036]
MNFKQDYLKKELYDLININSEIYDFIQESSWAGIWYKDLEQPKNEWVSPKFWITLGYSPADKSQQPESWRQLIFPEDLPVVDERMDKYQANPTIHYDEILRFHHKTGFTIRLRCRGLIIRDKKEKPIRVIRAYSDVTSLGQKEEALQRTINELNDSKKELQAFLDDSNDLIQSVDEEGRYLYVNRAWCKALGYTAQQASELTFFDIIDSQYHKHCKEQFALLMRNKEPLSVNVVFLSKTGKPIQVEGTISTHQSANGSHSTRGIFRDMTIRYAAEKELTKTEEMLEQTNRVARVGGWEFDLVRNTIFWTQMTKEIHEVEPDFVPDLTSGINFYKEGYSRDTIQRVVNQAIQTGEPYDVELQIITARGKERWVRAIGKVEFKDGKCVRMYGTFQDIDEQKKKESHLKLLESVITHAKDAVIIMEIKAYPDDHHIVYVNQSFCNMTGFSQNEVIGKTTRFLQGPETDRKELTRMNKAFRTLQPFEADFINYKKTGEKYWVNISVVPVADKNGRYTHWVAIQRDVTEQKLSEQNLVQAMEEARAASIAKSEFLANMSHEIRTPLNGVIGFSDLLMKSPLDANQMQYMQAVHHSANALLDLISDILDFSKIEAGKLELLEEKYDLWELMEQASDIVKHKVEEKNLELLLNIDAKIPQYAWIDPIRLRQILVNLLGNAVKFTETGEIEITVKLVSEDSESNLSSLEFSVRDTGIGIDSKRQYAIFKAFSQEDASTTRKYGGTGLGLTISNQLLALMNSKMELESKPGTGSRFFFNLSLKTESGESQLSKSDSTIQHVLIVDDHPKNLQIIQDMLSIVNIESDTAANGLEALEKIKNNTYDLLIIDYHMPQMNGVQVIREVRDVLHISQEELLVILLHSAVDDKEINISRQGLGVQKVMSKPITLHQLTHTLESIHAPVSEKLTVMPQITSASEVNILLVDDNPMNRILARKMIHNILPDASVKEAQDGADAVEKFLECNADIILMDIQMPVMSGYEASKKIREHDKDHHATIIALTASAVSGERERCLEAGMNDYLSKPFVLDTLKVKLEKWVKKDKSVPTLTIEGIAENQLTHFNLDECKANMDINDEVIIEELINELFKQLDKDLPLINEAFQNEDIEALNRLGHKHKSSIKIVGMNILAQLFASLEEQSAFINKDIEELIQQIEQEVQQVRVLVKHVIKKADFTYQ